VRREYAARGGLLREPKRVLNRRGIVQRGIDTAVSTAATAAATATHLICGSTGRWEAVEAVCVTAVWDVGFCGHSHSWGVAQLALVDHS
jgi:hypothetical protein